MPNNKIPPSEKIRKEIKDLGSFVFHVVFKVFNLGFNSPQC